MTKLDIEKIYINHFLDFLKQENIYNDFLNVIYKNTHFKNYMSLKNLPLSVDTYINFIKSWLHTPYLSKFHLTYLLTNHGVFFTKYDSKHSTYTFWARCQYEFLIAPWPLGSYEMKKKVRQVLLKENFDLGDYKDSIDFYNVIAYDMSKIDVHKQIMMNIDIIVDILWEEFYVTKV